MMDSRWKRPSPRYLQQGEKELSKEQHLHGKTPEPGGAPLAPALPPLTYATRSAPCPGSAPCRTSGERGPFVIHAGMLLQAGAWPLGEAQSRRLVIDISASISNRISSQQLHFKAFHSAALME